MNTELENLQSWWFRLGHLFRDRWWVDRTSWYPPDMLPLSETGTLAHTTWASLRIWPSIYNENIFTWLALAGSSNRCQMWIQLIQKVLYNGQSLVEISTAETQFKLRMKNKLFTMVNNTEETSSWCWVSSTVLKFCLVPLFCYFFQIHFFKWSKKSKKKKKKKSRFKDDFIPHKIWPVFWPDWTYLYNLLISLLFLENVA